MNTTDKDRTRSHVTRIVFILIAVIMVAVLMVIFMKTLEEVTWGNRPEFVESSFDASHGMPRLVKMEARCFFQPDRSIMVDFHGPPDCLSWDVQIWDRFGNLVETINSKDMETLGPPYQMCIGHQTGCPHEVGLDFSGRGWLIVRFVEPGKNFTPPSIVNVKQSTDTKE